jgi:hypothetical protein
MQTNTKRTKEIDIIKKELIIYNKIHHIQSSPETYASPEAYASPQTEQIKG